MASKKIGWKMYAFFASLLPLKFKMKINPPNPPPSLCIPVYRMRAFHKQNSYQTWCTEWINSGKCADVLYKTYPSYTQVKKYKWIIYYMKESLNI
jgi:hypothetical protein